MLLHGRLIRRDRIPEYFTQRNLSAISLWREFSLLGNPFGMGSLDWPAVQKSAIEACEAAHRMMNGNAK